MSPAKREIRKIVHKTSYRERPFTSCGLYLHGRYKSSESWLNVTCRRCLAARKPAGWRPR